MLRRTVLLLRPTRAIPANTGVQTNHHEAEKSEPETKLKRLNPIKLKQMRERLVEVEEEDRAAGSRHHHRRNRITKLCERGRNTAADGFAGTIPRGTAATHV